MTRPGTITLLVLAAVLVLAFTGFFSAEKHSSAQKPLPAFEEIVPLPRLVQGEKAPEMMYRWEDASGTPHFSDRPPEDYPSEAVPLDDRVNSLPSLRQKDE